MFFYNDTLVSGIQLILTMGQSQSTGANKDEKDDRRADYYELLGVGRDASDEEYYSIHS